MILEMAKEIERLRALNAELDDENHELELERERLIVLNAKLVAMLEEFYFAVRPTGIIQQKVRAAIAKAKGEA